MLRLCFMFQQNKKLFNQAGDIYIWKSYSQILMYVKYLSDLQVENTLKMLCEKVIILHIHIHMKYICIIYITYIYYSYNMSMSGTFPIPLMVSGGKL